MKELVIISGKGGTGKTTFTASFAALAKDAVFADCDVDAADLHLLLKPEIQQQEEFRSGLAAVINQDQCTHCGKCREVCYFDAIDATPVVNNFACEGCKICSYVCPVAAITMEERVCGEWYRSETPYGPMVHAKLGIVEENSGKLVSIVRQQAKRLAEERGKSLVLIDGPPGIGCPVISSIAGTTLVLVVTEPTLSGIHDLQRVAELTAHFRIPTFACVNKADINPGMTKEITHYCAEHDIEMVGEIPYDLIVARALVHHQTIVEYAQGAVTQALRHIWQRLEQELAVRGL